MALTKILEEKGLKVKLIVQDIRKTALNKAEKYAEKILGRKIETLKCNALEIDKYNIKADIALIYGISTTSAHGK